MSTPQPKPIPKPAPPKGASPAVIAAHATHPVKVPIAADVSEDELKAAAQFGAVADDTVTVTDGDATHEVGPATGDDPLAPYVKAYFELRASVERFRARLESAELSPKDIDESLASLTASLSEPKVVGDLPALRERFEKVSAEATEVRERIQEERRAARAEALAKREAIVTSAEEIAARDESQVHWKNDTATLRALLDDWKEAQRSLARIPKEQEKALWKRFTTARSSFEKARKHHFSELDKSNAGVATRKEQLVAQAERLAETTDWDRGARGFRDLMNEWKSAGRGRRSVDDALWKRFQTAQDSFFEARRSASDAEDAALAENVAPKEAAVVEAEALLPITDLSAAKQALRAAQDRFEAAGRVPRGDVARLNKRMSAVEQAVRDAEDKEWTSRNPELEARATGAAAQLQSAIAELEDDLAAAKSSGDKRKVKEAEEALKARRSWLEQIQGVVS
ncbi:DUF349 domain-containing protein [Demequina sp. NBRC 110053]|uniref:DUF349 domain-containing protein n=1 Tax=Demequina sp. NBRC 110053 TaxID=1570342 RepID=UPI00118573F4|nr:DUF349 domain-containing protein [Demequina sp. NBRC 110053]